MIGFLAVQLHSYPPGLDFKLFKAGNYTIRSRGVSINIPIQVNFPQGLVGLWPPTQFTDMGQGSYKIILKPILSSQFQQTP